MAVLFAGSSLSDFSNVTSYVANSTLTEYLAGSVQEGVRVKGDKGSFECSFQETSELWLSFTLAMPVFTGNTASQDYPLLSVFNSAYSLSSPLFRIIGVNAVYSLQFYTGSSYTTIGTVEGINAEWKARWDIHVKVSDTEGVFEIYKDGVLVGPAVPADTKRIASVEGVDRLRFQNPTAWTSAEIYFSGIIVSTSDTRGLELIQTIPVADGEMVEWTDGYSAVDDIGIIDTDFITSDTIGAISTFDFGPIPSAYSSMEIEAVVLSFRGQSGGGAVGSMEGVARIGGTNHAKTLETPIPPTFGPVQTIFQVNPATASPWTTSQVQAAEFGVKATA